MRQTKYSVKPLTDKPNVNEGDFLCDFCSRPYKTEKGLESHIEAKHVGD